MSPYPRSRRSLPVLSADSDSIATKHVKAFVEVGWLRAVGSFRPAWGPCSSLQFRWRERGRHPFLPRDGSAF